MGTVKNSLLLAASCFLFASFRPLTGSFVKEITPFNKPVALKKDAKKLAEYYRQRVLRGESMASIAKLYSEDPGSAPNGGLYNNIVRGQMVPEFEAVAFKLKPGEVSEVFETQYGFHFIQLISNKNEVLSLRHLLITRE
jgi:peptidyl-prolyl cis-trans isomerase SurA